MRKPRHHGGDVGAEGREESFPLASGVRDPGCCVQSSLRPGVSPEAPDGLE